MLDKITNIINKLSNIIDKITTHKPTKEEIEKQVNNEFNDKLENSNDTTVCDSIRKEKQKQIEEKVC